ncbi:MAG TPA: transketolase [Saprospiraceae bacterium]|nr:transketolase [Saprospiraceae bacterium]
MNKSIALQCADNIRILAAAMVEKANSGHPGGPMGGADFINILFSEFLTYDPDDMEWPFRDRFFLDAGHMSPMLYAQQVLCGNLTLEDIKSFRQWKSVTPGHPELDIKRGVENTSGPLGLGHAFGVGAAITEEFLVEKFGPWMQHYTYLYISDGGVQEEISQGVGRLAGFLGLGKVIMFYDANNVQLSTKVDEVMNEDTAAKYRSWHWHVLTIDGNDENQIRKALKEAQSVTDKPSLIIGHTTMGKGAVQEDGSSYEGEVETHGKPLGSSKASFQATIRHLGGDPENPFIVFPEVSEYYQTCLDAKRKEVAKRRGMEKDWSEKNPTLDGKLKHFLSGELPKLEWENIKTKTNDATRNASSAVLSYLADHVENMIVASADLSNSDKTDGFLKKRSQIVKGDFSGAFLQAGVSELTMAALATGMALHGGVIPVCATFFAFSDYMKPAIRVAALMEQQVIFVWTHDAFRVGEDGPTHQPVEQEAQIRLLEKLKNHSGKNSFLALRPADGPETVISWQMALENKNTPSGLILSRQNVEELLPDGDKSRYECALMTKEGAYIVHHNGDSDITLVANGSEVKTLEDASKILKEKHNINCRLVSAPSEGLFRSQSRNYQEEVLPHGLPIFGLTAGLPVTLEGLVGCQGKVYGLDHFGYSAPYTVLDEKFGFTPEHVAREIVKFLDR